MPGSNTRCFVCNEKKSSYHSFPKERSELFRWMNLLGLEDVPGPYSRLCSLHFRPSDILTVGNNRQCIRPGALPLTGPEVPFKTSNIKNLLIS